MELMEYIRIQPPPNGAGLMSYAEMYNMTIHLEG